MNSGAPQNKDGSSYPKISSQLVSLQNTAITLSIEKKNVCTAAVMAEEHRSLRLCVPRRAGTPVGRAGRLSAVHLDLVHMQVGM